MCQLLGMNCATPTDFNFSFQGFARRGGDTDKHEHGWGLAIYEGRGLRTFIDPLPAAISPVAELVARYPMKTLNMMAHIRYATQGTVSLENVHPFQREMWGIQWCFAHNGELPKYSNKNRTDHPLLSTCKTTRRELSFHPVGDTDSEAVFCAILNALRAEFATLPTLPLLYETIQRFCTEIVAGEEESTIFNFLLGCGQYTLFAYSWPGARPGSTVWNGLFYTVRKPPFATAKLADVDYAVDFSKVTNPTDRVAVIATKPLTIDEDWTEFKRGQLLMFDNGLPYSELYDCDEIEQQGRGLHSRFMQKATKECAPKHRYDTPVLLRSLLDSAIHHSKLQTTWAKRGADLGCGTGLSGLALRSCVQHMVGVDLSREMVDKARERGCYDHLVVGGVECILRRNSQDDVRGACDQVPIEPGNIGDASGDEGNIQLFDVIFACDVLVYIGDLRSMFHSVRNSLIPGGLFAFSAEFIQHVEDADVTNTHTPTNIPSQHNPPFVLQSCARFAHTRSYVEGLASEFGFEKKTLQASTMHKKGCRDVQDVLAVFGLPS